MKALFYLGVIGLLVFEFLKVYFIMPFPGSQKWDTIELAYFLHQYRWVFRVIFVALGGIGIASTFSQPKKWIPILALLVMGVGVAMVNFKMAADAMFQEPIVLSFSDDSAFEGNDSTLVVAVEHQGEAKAYPVRYIVYHHQVRDTVGGEPMMITYCSVCRTGRVFSPIVNDQPEKFRLVGMDHFNAMFEDSETGSWWQQATGEAIVGELKGKKLEEFESVQVTAGAFFRAYPNGKIMDADPNFLSKYDSLGKFEKGKGESKLTGTDSNSWSEKSWVVGVNWNGEAKAYDWNALVKTGSIRDRLGNQDIVLLLSKDSQSFVVFEIPPTTGEYRWTGDSLYLDTLAYSFVGKSIQAGLPDLKRIQASQEFWHSWRTFQPNSKVFPEK